VNRDARIPAGDEGDLLELALTATQTAGGILMRARDRSVQAGASAHKSSPTDPVTEADTAAQHAIADSIGRSRPHDALLGEEQLSRTGSTRWRWVIDPLDSTVNYLRGADQFAVSIAAEDENGAAVGVVHAPALSRTYSAIRGKGARINGRRLTVRRGVPLSAALVGTGFSYLTAGRERQATALVRVLPRVADIRRSGPAALGLAAVADGTIDAFYEDDLQAWDWMAGSLLVTEAGGVVSPLSGPDGSGVLAAGPELHRGLASLLNAADWQLRESLPGSAR